MLIELTASALELKISWFRRCKPAPVLGGLRVLGGFLPASGWSFARICALSLISFGSSRMMICCLMPCFVTLLTVMALDLLLALGF